jgi:hypothetical protein
MRPSHEGRTLHPLHRWSAHDPDFPRLLRQRSGVESTGENSLTDRDFLAVEASALVSAVALVLFGCMMAVLLALASGA